MEACRIYALSLWSVPNDQAHSPLQSSSNLHDSHQSHHVFTQSVAAIGLVGNLGIHHDHEFKASDLYHMDGLCNTDPLHVADVEFLTVSVAESAPIEGGSRYGGLVSKKCLS